MMLKLNKFDKTTYGSTRFKNKIIDSDTVYRTMYVCRNVFKYKKGIDFKSLRFKEPDFIYEKFRTMLKQK